MNFLLQLLLPFLGKILAEFVLPLLNKAVKSKLDQLLPLAERWVKAVETTSIPGVNKKAAAFQQILIALKTDEAFAGLQEIELGLIDTAIQLAWVKLGYDKSGKKV